MQFHSKLNITSVKKTSHLIHISNKQMYSYIKNSSYIWSNKYINRDEKNRIFKLLMKNSTSTNPNYGG